MKKLFQEGISFEQYITAGSEEDRQKHLHYVNKLELTEEEKRGISSIETSKNLLVFSDLFCPDCRITISVLENVRELNRSIAYAIISREGHQGLMEELSGDHRIPLIIDITEEEPRVIYNEYPKVIKEKMEQSDQEEKDHLKLQYRKGFYKKEMLEQLIEGIKGINGSDIGD